MIQQWLAQQIARIDSVQRCQVTPDGVIVVHSWRGIIIHVRLITQPDKARSLKRLVTDATRIGVGTLFLIDAALIPPDGQRLVPPEWLLALHALTDDKLYAYRLVDDLPQVVQVHFRPTNKPDERDVWYGPHPVAIQQLPFYRVWIKTPSAIKGDYLIANFGTDPFWRDADYRGARFTAADQARRASGRPFTQYEFGVGGANAGPQLVQRPKSRLAEALERLGLPETATCDEIKTAFRKLALEVHPDTSPLPKAEAEARFRDLNDTYTYIRQQRDDCG